ncbi:MAG: sigma-70 family RNA polymerase sigma factor [Clostridiaceae bacterium]|nr:sigma-70 family RNA polymerase sigma factor [Clostridiaceae bacterium]
MELTDYEIIRQCLKGNKDAFAEIVTRYKKLVYTIVLRMINDKEEANDVAQEVFIKLYRSLDRYDPRYKFSTWAVKITSNYCLDILRKKKVETTSVDDMIYEPGHNDSPESAYLKLEQKKRIEEAINSLPDKYKLPIILFHQHGYSYEEICEILDEPLSIVKNRLHRARHMLREKLVDVKREEAL